MKSISKYLIACLLVLLFLANGLMFYYIKETEKPHPSITKLTFADDNNTVVYCDKAADASVFKIDLNENTFQFGDAKLIGGESLYLQTGENKINLSEYDAQGFVISDSGEILYSLVTPTLKKQKVFVTPNGGKYHTDAYCAGRTGFEIDYETAIMFDREPCKLCA